MTQRLSDWTALPPEVFERVCEAAGVRFDGYSVSVRSINEGSFWGPHRDELPATVSAALAFGGLVVLANDRVSPGMEPDLRHGFRVCDKNDDTIGEADTLPAAVLAALRRVYS